jgi:hypothetical protein
LIYFPEKITQEVATKIGNQQDLLPWHDARGVQMGWKQSFNNQATAPKFNVLIFHGNAGYALHRRYVFELFKNSSLKYNWDCYIMEYPGYGARADKPTELTIKKAAYRAMESLKLGEPIILLGESLGCAVASAVAKEYPDRVKGMILVTPFNSLKATAQKHYSWLPVSWLLHDKWLSDANLKNYSGPIAFIIAEDDEIIPHELSKTLYEGYLFRKKLWVVPGSHNKITLYLPHVQTWKEVLGFLFENE